MKNLLITCSALAMLLFGGCKKAIVQSVEGLSNQKLSSNFNNFISTVGTIYYVDPLGDDNNNGMSTSTPWKSISKVNTVTFAPGDQILFKAGGVWTGNLAPLGSGSAGSPIIIDKYGTGNKPVINGGGLTNGSITLLLNNQSFWEINNLEITNTVNSGQQYAVTGIKVNNSGTTAASNITINNCYVHHVNSTGFGTPNYNKGSGGIIFTGLINNVLVLNCHVKDCDIEGIRTSSSVKADNVVFEGNLIENIYGDGIVFNGVKNSKITHNILRNTCKSDAANYAACWTYGSLGTIISYNEVSGIKGGGPYDGQAFDADIDTNGDIFEYNYSHDNDRGFMLFMPSAQNIIVRYNISVNDVKNANSSPSGSKLINYTSNYTTNKIYNNTFYTNDSFTRIFQYTNTASTFAFNSTFSNNIIYATGTITRFSDRPIMASAVFKNNCFYPQSITAVNGPAGTVSGSTYTDPKFNNASSTGTPSDFKLQKTSPLIAGAVNITNNGGIDYFQTNLPLTNPDVGFAQSSYSFTGFVVNADTYVRNGTYADNNYGTENTFIVKSDASSYARKAYLKFDFSALSGTAVSNARLVLNASSVNTDPSRTISIYTATTNNWTEAGLTWNNAPLNNPLVSSFVAYGADRYSIDVTNVVNQNLSTGNKIITFVLTNDAPASSKSDIYFISKEQMSNKPQLNIIL